MAPVWAWAVDKLEWQFAYDNKDRLIKSIDPCRAWKHLVYDYHDKWSLRSLMKKYPSGGDARYEFDRYRPNDLNARLNGLKPSIPMTVMTE